MSQAPVGASLPAQSLLAQREAEAAELAAAEAAELAAAASAASPETVDTRLARLIKFVEDADKQVSNTSTTFALVAFAICGLILVLLPGIFVFIGETTRFPNADYLVTSLIEAVLLIGSVVGLVVDSRGKSGDRKALFSTGAEVIDRLDQSAARNKAAQLAARGNG
jgi:hypothetical protein